MSTRRRSAFEFGLVMASLLPAQGIIVTVAGSDYVFPDDGKPALQAEIALPGQLSFEPNGNLLIASPSLRMVLRLTTAGVIEVVAGTGIPGRSQNGTLARNASLDSPQHAVADSAGNIFIVDTFYGTVSKITTDGKMRTIAGGSRPFTEGGLALTSRLDFPVGLSVDSRDRLLIASLSGNRILRVNSDGTLTTVAGTGSPPSGPPTLISEGGPPAIQFPIDGPRCVAAAPDGGFYIGEQSRLIRVDSEGRVRWAISFGGTVRALGVDGNGEAYYATGGSFPLTKASLTGQTTIVVSNVRIGTGFSGDGGPATNARFNGIRGVAVRANGEILLSDQYNDRIRAINSAGIVRTVAGKGRFVGDGGLAVNAQIVTPAGIAIDRSGNLFIADDGDYRIRKVDPSGIITTFLGDGGIETRKQDIAIDAKDDLYFLDDVRLYRVLPDGRTVVVAGNGSQTYNGEGIPAVNAGLFPSTVAVDKDGIFYIGEWSGRVRRVGGDGLIRTVAQFSASIRGLAPDGQGGLYITASGAPVPADGGEAGVFRLSPGGALTRVAGQRFSTPESGDAGPALQAQLSPGKLAVDGEGNLYIASSSSVRKVDSNGIISTFAGGRFGFAGDGGLATNAAMRNPRGLAFDSKENLYAADASNRRVRLVTRNPAPSIVLSQRGLLFSSVGTAGAAPQSFVVVNGGNETLNWFASVTTASGGNWLRVSPASGTSQHGEAGKTVEVQVNGSGLAPGDYYGQIQIRAPGVPNSPQSITVVLSIKPVAGAAELTAAPNGLLFTGAPGSSNPTPQSITLATTSTTAVEYSATASFPGGQAWFTLPAVSGTVALGRPAAMQVRPSIGSLGAGIYPATIELAFTGGLRRRVELLLVLAAGGAVSAKTDRRPADCTPARLLLLFSSVGAQFNATVGFPVPLELRMVNDCGAAVGAGDVRLSFSNGDPDLSLVSLQDGRWSGTWQPRGFASTTITARGRSSVPALNATASVAIGVQDNLNLPPEVARGGVLSAASFRVGSVVAPGSLVAIFGSRLAGAQSVAGTLPLPRLLGETQVSIGGRSLPLLFSSDGQVNAQIPYDLELNSDHQLVVRRGRTISLPERVGTLPTQSGVFTQSQRGDGAGIVVGVKADGGQFLVNAASPATAGDVLVVYGSGLGNVEPPVPAGFPAPLDPLSRTIIPVRVSIGGVEATVLFSGLAPEFAGLYQVNVLVPPGVAAGNEVPLVITQGELSSLPVTVAIR